MPRTISAGSDPERSPLVSATRRRLLRRLEPLRLWLDLPRKRLRLRARLLEPYWRWRFAGFGAGSVLHRPRWIAGARKIEIGAGVTILHDAWIAAEDDAWSRPEPAIRIGDRCAIRTGCTISASESVILEEDVTLAGNVLVTDSDHDWTGPHAGVTANPLVAAPVRIGRGTWLAENVAVLRGSSIGEHCVIGANSVVRGDIPPGSIAVGAPARVVGSTGRGAGEQAVVRGTSPAE